MKTRYSNQRSRAMTLIEVLIVVVTSVLLACLLLPAFASARKKAQRIHCVSNLKQIGMAFRIWEGDHGHLYPMGISTNFGGTLEYVASGQTFQHFQVMSNELSTPYVLICLADVRPRAKDFGPTLGNKNVSYFVGVDAGEAKPEMLLSGDRNIVGGTQLANGIREITTNQLVSWSSEMHNGVGNIGLVDGSVVALGHGGFADWPEWQPKTVATNRLALP
jgi:competence protein ComGC